MKILYGVQGTGQGHISRARAMAAALKRHRVEVTWLFSGRERAALFDMAPFGDFEHRRGLTFTTHGGRMSHLATLRDNNIFEFLRDSQELDLSAYDAVVTDFEPVSAWAARRAGVRCIGIGHQYAFVEETPKVSHHWLGHQIMQRFAPADVPLGLHWHPYSGNILPPILDLPDLVPVQGPHILVYLPFEDQDDVTRLLQRFPEQQFVQYSAAINDGICANVTRRRASITHFKRHLSTCSAVICNSGFELISECLQWGKPILTRPLAGQVEQVSNALALQQLGYASVIDSLSETALAQWLHGSTVAPCVRFPDVADTLAHWLAAGATATPGSLSERLWEASSQVSGPYRPATKDTPRACSL